MEPATLRQLVGSALLSLRKAALVGVLVWVPTAALAWWTGRTTPSDLVRHTAEFGFADFPQAPAGLDALRTWVTGQPGIEDVEVRLVAKPDSKVEWRPVSKSETKPGQKPETKPGTKAEKEPGTVIGTETGTETQQERKTVQLRYRSMSREPLAPPWEELGYAKPSWTSRQWSGKFQIGVHQGIGFYLFLLARCLDVGFLVAGIGWFRRSRRSGWPLPRLFRGAARPAAIWGLVVGFVLAGLAWLYRWWAGNGIAGAWPLAAFWPAWTWILSLSLLPLVFLLCQELFFRGALFGSFQRANRPMIGVVVSALFFTLAQLDPGGAPVFLVIGLAQAWLYQGTGSLLAPLVAGVVYTGLAIILPSFVVGPELLLELKQGLLQSLQNVGK